MTDRRIDSTYLADYMRCPEYCRLRHHCGYRKPVAEMGPLELGTLVHKTLATYYRTLDIDAALLAFDEHSAVWEVRSKLDGTYATKGREKTVLTVAGVRGVTKRFLEDEARHWKTDIKVESVEEYLEAEIADGVTYCGITDLVVRVVNEPAAPDDIILLDHKTTRRNFVSNATMEGLRDSLQMPGYFLLRDALGKRTDHYAYNMLLLNFSPSGAKVPFERSVRFHMEQWRLDNALRTITQEVASIPEDATQAWSRRPQGCFAFFRMCEFHPVCYTHAELRPQLLEQHYIIDFWDPKAKAEED